ncbi:VOC family protein [Ornithinimicrobium cavernae]|uniref:VOC family protein n=1 Tax=Ornithinimicrobium cavernae TaxID=2666047 RepID=UPI000D68A6C7|nr:VOC family protein [Ornithinimicrobium cavernae]
MSRALHHVDLWVDDLDRAEAQWGWLLGRLGWSPHQGWGTGRSWIHPDGTYLGLEQSPDLVPGGHDRHRAGLNHLALTCADRAALDSLRSAAGEHGWHELFGDRYPHAGGTEHTALFLEDGQGFEVEIVVGGA